MPLSRIDVEGEIDRVYARPLAEFIEARKALAARLAAEGLAKDAARVKDLKKPSTTAWAVNQLRSAAPEVLESLLEAGVVYGHAPGSPAVGRLTEELAAPGFDEIASLGLLGT